MMKEYSTSARIAAAPETVWSVLSDAAAYEQWNPEIVGIVGRFAPDTKFTARVRLGSGVVRNVPQRVTAFEPPGRMEWTGGLPLGLFVGRRTFTIVPVSGGAEFRMDVRMSGPLAPLILKSVGDRQPEIDRFSAALKQRAETARSARK